MYIIYLGKVHILIKHIIYIEFHKQNKLQDTFITNNNFYTFYFTYVITNKIAIMLCKISYCITNCSNEFSTRLRVALRSFNLSKNQSICRVN